MLSINEQESFMHLIYDVIHIGVSFSNLEWKLNDMKNKFGDLSIILNTRMKNEKYSESFDLPIMKIILEDKNHIGFTYDKFYENKLKSIQLFHKYGASLDILNEKYKNELVDWTYYLEYKKINQNIMDFIKNNTITIKI
jgi:hypothetical protein